MTLNKYRVELISRRKFISVIEADSAASAIEEMQELVASGNQKNYDEYAIGPIVTIEEKL